MDARNELYEISICLVSSDQFIFDDYDYSNTIWKASNRERAENQKAVVDILAGSDCGSDHCNDLATNWFVQLHSCQYFQHGYGVQIGYNNIKLGKNYCRYGSTCLYSSVFM